MRVLRQYQQNSIDETRLAIRDGIRRILLVGPCGSGKSIIFAAISALAFAKSNRVLVIVHRRELVRQAVAHLTRAGLPEPRVFLAGRATGPADSPIAVGSIDTLRALPTESMPQAAIVLWDEAHHTTCQSFRTVAAHYAASIHVGFTATPQRADGTPLGDIFDRLIVVAQPSQLIAEKHLVAPSVWAPAQSQSGIAERADVAYLERGQSRRAIIFCANIPHSKRTTAALVSASVSAEHVDGSMSESSRDAVLSRFASGETSVLTNCTLVGEGFDVPACKLVIFARGCTSPVMWIQGCGRPMRPDDSGLADALVLDLKGAVHKHGLPDADREYSLDGKPIRLSQAAASIHQCLRCGRVFDVAGACPACGYCNPPPKDPAVRRAELARIFATDSSDQRREYYSRLVREALEKGYKPKWAAIRFKAKYGEWPRRAST